MATPRHAYEGVRPSPDPVAQEVSPRLKLELLITSTDLDENLSEEIASRFEIRRYAPGEELRSGPGVFRVVLWGRVLVTSSARERQRQYGPLSLLGGDAVVAGIQGRGGGASAGPVVIAQERTTVLELASEHFQEIFTTAGQPNALFMSLARAVRLQELAPVLVETLSTLPELASIPARTLQRLLDGAEIIEGQPPLELLEQGQPVPAFYVALEGSFDFRRSGTHRMREDAPAVVGLAELVRGHPMEFSVSSSGAARMIRLKAETFWELFKQDPDFRSAVARNVNEEIDPSHARSSAAGNGVFVLYADPSLPEEYRDERVLRGMADLLAERLALRLCDRVLVLHVMPPGSPEASRRWSVRPRPVGLGEGQREELEPSWIEHQDVVLSSNTEDVGRRIQGLLASREVPEQPDVTLVDICAIDEAEEGDVDLLEMLRTSKDLRFKLVHLLARPDVEPPLELLASRIGVVRTALLLQQEPIDSLVKQGDGGGTALALSRVRHALDGLKATARERLGVVLDAIKPREVPSSHWPAGTVRVRLGKPLVQALRQWDSTQEPQSFEALALGGSDKESAMASIDRWARGITGRRIGLALGGGGMYGSEHLPLIRGLLAQGVPIDVIAGSSVGSTVGAYFATRDEAGLELFTKRINPILLLMGTYFLTSAVFEWLLLYDLGFVQLDETEIVFIPVVTDADLGVEWDVRHGTYARGVRASGSLPPMGPTIIGGSRYIDGGVVANVPINVVRQEGVGVVIASNCIPNVRRRPQRKPGRIPLSRFFLESNPLLRAEDLLRMVPMFFRGLGESQARSADVMYRSVSQDRKRGKLLQGSGEAVEREGETLQVQQAVAEAQSALRRLLRHPPAAVHLGPDEKTLVYYGWVGFEGAADLTPRSSSALDEIAKFLRAHLELKAVTVRVTAEAEALGRQRARTLCEYLRRRGVTATELREEGAQGEDSISFEISPELRPPEERAELEERLEQEQLLRKRAETRALSRTLTLAASTQCSRGDLELGRLLAIEAAELDPGPETDRVLRLALARRGWCTSEWSAGTLDVTHLEYSPDGRLVATGCEDGFVRIWDALHPRPQPLHQIEHIGGSDPGIRGLAWSPNGQLIASAGRDRRIRIHQRAEGEKGWRQLAILEVGSWDPYGVQFSPRSERLLGTGPNDKKLSVWSVQPDGSWTPTSTLSHSASVRCAAWSPDGNRVASGAADGSVSLWEGLGRGEVPRKVLATELGSVSQVAWHRGGDRIAVATEQGARVFTRAGLLCFVCDGHRGPVIEVAWSPDGRWLMTTGEDGAARIWEANTGRFMMILRMSGSLIAGARWHPDSKRVATWDQDTRCVVWQALTGELEMSLYGHLSVITQAAWRPGQDSVLLTGSVNGTLREWRTTACAQVSFTEHEQAVSVAACHPSQAEWALSASEDGSVCVWSPSTGQRVSQLLPKAKGQAWASWSPDGRWVAAIRYGEAQPVLFRTQDWKAREAPAFQASRLHDTPSPLVGVQLAFSPDSRLLAVKFTRGVAVWDVETGRWLGEYRQAHDFHAVAWEPRLSGGESKRARLAVSCWQPDGAAVHDAQTLQPLLPLTYPGDPSERDGVWALAYEPQGRFLVTACNNGKASLFDARSGEPLKKPTEEPLMLPHQGGVTAAAWCPEGQWLATGDTQGVHVWSAQVLDGTLQLEPASEADSRRTKVCALAWEPRGRYLASGGADGQVLIWEWLPRARKEGEAGSETWSWSVTRRLEGHTGEVRALSISPDGRFVIAAGANRVLVHPIDPGELRRRVAEIPGRLALTPREWSDYMAEAGLWRPSWPRPQEG
ncbi:patatin-like phospholipase family protein [Hyalangium gracile]|uniref:patatin-like phospholipase family protein n=1 Tax=Hyalangium gracile TaxID=394092 RepID=UPI001CCF9FCA|nr:patatin-like phospholipase family protein [Hyalangium gracile]